MYYTRLQVICDPNFSEILMAEIAEAGFDTFMETEKGFEAYAEEKSFNETLVNEIKEKYAEVNPLLFFYDKVKKQNWNEEWEKSLQPIIVDDKCLIRAEFHRIEKKYPYEIVITPKMSFGTGHHQTTYLMIQSQMGMNHQNKRVMDAGCGTAILSIMASKLGAKEVEAFDIDEWSTINGKENIENNHCPNVRIHQGKIADMNFEGRFDIILANINKNILLAEMESYSSFLAPKGQLLLSGFYVQDVEDIERSAQKYGLQKVGFHEKETWSSVLFIKTV
ncbi:MAG: 50S ribosomal protein L11 methyltransferase [Bacteroidota bacterium]|jgi:ribosomal protein L11 methyltransferase|nr:50S ribosomal protein L11 methyltransferase [Cytophagales bacterium]MCE2956892.1 50S ribosomal protein L11 methyltransferase [Flammeovirgaceae bacterium]MCZ8070883.1 50S ribosomal protein L11 methyltransferase [Cytophagales bacterium]